MEGRSGGGLFWETGLPTWERSDEVVDDFFRANHGAGGEGFLRAFGVNAVGDEAIFLFVNFINEAEPEALEVGVFEAALEEGMLDADAEVFADFGDVGEAFGVGDVLAEESEHLFLTGR